jgi:hypothetical protein
MGVREAREQRPAAAIDSLGVGELRAELNALGPSAAMRPSRTASAASYRIDPASSAVTIVVSWISWIAAIARYCPVARRGSQADGGAR